MIKYVIGKSYGKKHIIQLRNGLKFQSLGDITDIVVVVETFGGESNYDQYLDKSISSDMSVIDIGANIGTTSIIFLRTVLKFILMNQILRILIYYKVI